MRKRSVVPLWHVPGVTIYQIVRFRQSGRRRVLQRYVSLEAAQAHCSSSSTSGPGWFDGYERMPGF